MLGEVRTGAGPLLGRDAELKLLTSLLDGIPDSGGALVLRGEPGIGKSRLLEEAARLACERGFVVLSTTGVQSETRLAFAGLHQLLRPVRARVADLPPAHRAALDAAFGLNDEGAPEPFRLAMAVLDLLSEVASESPVLAIAEDAHWLDGPSADVLAFVARRVESDPIVLLAAARDGTRSTLSEAGLPEHRIDALDPEAAAALLDASGPRLPAAVRERLLHEAGGNPLALIELPVEADDAPVTGPLPLTERLEQAFAARVSDLPDETRLLLLVAALNDEDHVTEVLEAGSAVAGIALELDHLQPAADAAIVDLDVQTVRFRHPLIRSAVRQRASVEQRRRVHEALGDALDGDPERSVWHCAALIAGVHEDKAVELEEAGRRARRRGATDVAVTAFRRAAELSDRAQRGRRLLAAAQLAQELGRPDIVVPLLREVEQLDPGPHARARATWIEEMVDPRPLGDEARVTALIAAARHAGEAGDRDLHVDLLWLVAQRAWWADPGGAARRLLIEAARELGDAETDDPRVFATHAYADPIAHAPAVLARLRASRHGAPPRQRRGSALWPGRADRRRLRHRHDDRQLGGREPARGRTTRAPPAHAHPAGHGRRATGRLGHRDSRGGGGAPPGDRARPAAVGGGRRHRPLDDRRDAGRRRGGGARGGARRACRNRERRELPHRPGPVREGPRRAGGGQARRSPRVRRAPLRSRRSGSPPDDRVLDHR